MTRFLKGGTYALVYGATAFLICSAFGMQADEALLRAFWYGFGAAAALWFAA